MSKVENLFDVRYGVNLELNSMRRDPTGVNFVSRSEKNNGVVAKVGRLVGVSPIPAGTISVAGGGSVMASFLQPEPYYSGRDLYYLTPKVEMTDSQKLYYCACLRANRYRFNYGRQANKTLREMAIPALSELPEWVGDASLTAFDGKAVPASTQIASDLNTNSWRIHLLADLFTLQKGVRLTKADMLPGQTPFVGAIDINNGVSGFVGQPPLHPANTLTVPYNGNGVAEAFYQPKPYRCSDDVNVLYPKFRMNAAIGLFIATVIRREKYRFSYGRKWHLERMEQSEIRLPSTQEGKPDYDFMERYILTLPFSSELLNITEQEKANYYYPAAQETEPRDHEQPALPYLAEIAETVVY